MDHISYTGTQYSCWEWKFQKEKGYNVNNNQVEVVSFFFPIISKGLNWQTLIIFLSSLPCGRESFHKYLWFNND